MNDPRSRDSVPGWWHMHQANQNWIVVVDDTKKKNITSSYGIVFYGDDLMEQMNGITEDAAVLGILRVAQEIHAAFAAQSSIVLIQGLLPWTSRHDGHLEDRKSVV